VKRWEVYERRTGRLVCIGSRRYTRQVCKGRPEYARHKVEIAQSLFEGMGETLP